MRRISKSSKLSLNGWISPWMCNPRSCVARPRQTNMHLYTGDKLEDATITEQFSSTQSTGEELSFLNTDCSLIYIMKGTQVCLPCGIVRESPNTHCFLTVPDTSLVNSLNHHGLCFPIRTQWPLNLNTSVSKKYQNSEWRLAKYNKRVFTFPQ